MDHTHCLSPARAREADAAVTSSSYARLFPDLPAFTADEAFLYALGRAGGLCDCGDAKDDEGVSGNGVGARIVGEVLVGLLDLDPASVRHAPDDWRPTASLIQLLGHA